MKTITTNVNAAHESNKRLISIAKQLETINQAIKELNKKYNVTN